MLELAQKYYNLPSDTVAKILGTSNFGTSNSSQIYAESSLDSTLESGQLDASSAFVTQAIELHLDYIPLPPAINLGSAALARTYSTATVKLERHDQERLAAGHRHHDDWHPDPGRRGVHRPTRCPPPASRSTRQGGFALITPTVVGRQERRARRDPQ